MIHDEIHTYQELVAVIEIHKRTGSLLRFRIFLHLENVWTIFTFTKNTQTASEDENAEMLV